MRDALARAGFLIRKAWTWSLSFRRQQRRHRGPAGKRRHPAGVGRAVAWSRRPGPGPDGTCLAATSGAAHARRPWAAAAPSP